MRFITNVGSGILVVVWYLSNMNVGATGPFRSCPQQMSEIAENGESLTEQVRQEGDCNNVEYIKKVERVLC